MTYDALDGYIVLFGGFSRLNIQPPDTWIFSNDRWVNITSSAGVPPTPRYGMGMTYDPVDSYVLAFGGGTAGTCGQGNAADCNDTWSFRGGRWTKLSPATAPAPTWGAGMTYDAADRYVLLFGGSGNVGTWNYSHGVWNQIASPYSTSYVQPSPRYGMGMTYDARDGYVLLFGGYGFQINEVFGDTWTFSGGVWTNLRPSPAPSPRETTTLAYDVAAGAAVLFGGATYYPDAGPPFPLLNDTWSFAGGSWMNLTSGPAPAARFASSIANDTADSCILLFAGTEQLGTAGNQNDTWGWCAAPPFVGLEVMPAPVSPLPGAVVTFSAGFRGGVAPFNYSWAFGDGGTSTSPNPVHAYLAAGYYAVHLWVNDSAGHAANTSTVLRVYVPLATPSLAASPNPAILGQPVNFTSSVVGGTPPYTYAWSFGDGGTGGNLSSITHVYTTNGPFLSELTVSDSLGAVVHAFLNITIQLQALVQSTATAGASPLVVSFTGAAQGGEPPYSYSWNFGDDSPISTVQNPSHVFGSPGSYAVVLTITDSGGANATSSIRIQVGGASMGAFPLELVTGGLGFAAGVAATAGFILWRNRRSGGSSREAPKPGPPS